MNYTPVEASYREEHNDDVNPFEEMIGMHEKVWGHDPKEAHSFCETCLIIFQYMVEDGLVCQFHPGSYFEPKTKTSPAKCDQCEMEEGV